MSGATLPCAVALSPLSTQISARGVVTASTGSRCASLHLPRDLPTEGPPTPERNELVKRRAAGRKNISPGVFRHSAVKDIVKSQKNLSSRATEHCMEEGQQSFSDKQCSICYREVCHPFTKKEQSCFDKTVLELQERRAHTFKTNIQYTLARERRAHTFKTNIQYTLARLELQPAPEVVAVAAETAARAAAVASVAKVARTVVEVAKIHSDVATALAQFEEVDGEPTYSNSEKSDEDEDEGDSGKNYQGDETDWQLQR